MKTIFHDTAPLIKALINQNKTINFRCHTAMQRLLARFVQIDKPYLFHRSVFDRKPEELGSEKLFAHEDIRCTPCNLSKLKTKR